MQPMSPDRNPLAPHLDVQGTTRRLRILVQSEAAWATPSTMCWYTGRAAGRGANVSSTAMVTCFGRGCPGTSLLNSTISFPGAPSGSLSGWTAGGGVEWGFLPNWTLRAEYLHLHLMGSKKIPACQAPFSAFR